MAKGTQVTNGKAFEYACILALYMDLKGTQDISIENSPQLETAQDFYKSMDESTKGALDSAAHAAVRMIRRLEPQLVHDVDGSPLFLSLQVDAEGAKGDVRDVLCVRKQNDWEIGFSCKHNHHAVKHSRLSATIDFGKEWFGIPCTKQYFDEVVPLFTDLAVIRDKSKADGNPALWKDVENKAEKYYIPILQSFMDELKRIAEQNAGIPEALIRYLLGRNDFYKIITDDKSRTTRVEAINTMGTLNRSAGSHKPITKVPLLKMPTKFYHIDFKPGSDNTIEVICDEGWQISMRIHSASSRIEPSLKFDVQLISFPTSVHAQVEPWGNGGEEKQFGRVNMYGGLF